ncbi:MAG: nuclear transport factor 2 family protein [Actinomycetota bacterium]|nr:nuclear transport factor 2 family protein [Actinomycetota bacterium]
MTGRELLDEHVDLFNAAVRSGDFGPMLEQFDDDAEMELVGVPVGPFRGREEIAAAYREQPPDDELELLDVGEQAGHVAAGYAWLREPGVRAGELQISHDGAAIRKLVVSFE